tara:strand:- start:226 stop:543 length:318 start_codon:yes stop_codon:yes gene_type:complete
MSKKRKKIAKALKTIIPLLGLGAVMAGRGRSGGGDPNMIMGPDIKVSPMNMDDQISIDAAQPIMPNRIGAFAAAKGGRAGYGKGGKVARGCGKIMKGRNKKTKYI